MAVPQQKESSSGEISPGELETIIGRAKINWRHAEAPDATEQIPKKSYSDAFVAQMDFNAKTYTLALYVPENPTQYLHLYDPQSGNEIKHKGAILALASRLEADLPDIGFKGLQGPDIQFEEQRKTIRSRAYRAIENTRSHYGRRGIGDRFMRLLQGK